MSPRLAWRAPLGALIPLWVLSAALLGAQAPPARSASAEGEVQPEDPGRAPYRVLDNVEGPWINLNAVPVRPLAHDPASGDTWALDTHGSTVVRIDPAGAVVRTIRTPWSPVAVGLWRERLLVVCQGTHALVAYDPDSGALLDLLALPPEPNDLLVDAATDTAFVSTSGRDVVVAVDLVAWRAVAEHPLRSKRAQALSIDARGDVYVAPLLSGNNTSAEYAPKPRRAGKRVLDLSDPAVARRGLPDEDLFRIRRDTGAIEPAAVGLGTVLYAHGFHPRTGELWMVGTDALNADPERQTEAALRGEFSRSVLAIAALAERGEEPVGPRVVVELDEAATVGTPSALVFALDGTAFVTGLSSDDVTCLDERGAARFELDLQEGAIPRGLALADGGRQLLVHCWGNNTVELWELDPRPERRAVVALGFDPAPPLVQRGRELFYDGGSSRDGNLSCASCHVEGRSDMLTWNLSSALDDKGPLFTQSLVGIEPLAPFHWRGERAGLEDFQPAFGDLLGGPGPLDTTPGGDFDAFRAFVFSLQARANPFQDRERVVSAEVQPTRVPGSLAPADAVRGQELYFSAETVEHNSCDACHALPLGTNHDLFADDTEGTLPRRATFKVAAFNELWRKEQPIVEPEVLDEHGQVALPKERALLGAGLTHAGRGPDLFRFMRRFGLPRQDTIDVTAFVHQLDQGLAPAVHAGVHLGPTPGRAAAAAELRSYLVPQARLRNCDLAVLGFGEGALDWVYDRRGGVFRPGRAGVEPRRLADFLGAREESHLFLGLPVGMAAGFAVDRDRDGLFDRDEALHGADPLVADTDGDGSQDGHEVEHGSDPADPAGRPRDERPPVIRGLELLWVTTTTARLAWRTDEPTVYALDYRSPRGHAGRLPAGGGFSSTPMTTHSVLVSGLWPSTRPRPTMNYVVTLRARDRGGNVVEQRLPGGIVTRPFIERLDGEHSPETVVDELAWREHADPDVLVAAARVRFRQGGPPALPAAGYVLVARVFVDGEPAAGWQPRGGAGRVEDFTLVNAGGGFEQPGLEPGFSRGPYLLSRPTTEEGTVELGFALAPVETSDPGDPGDLVVAGERVEAGRRVTLNLEAVLPISDPDTYAASLEACGSCATLALPVHWPLRDLTRWVLADTPPRARALSRLVPAPVPAGGPLEPPAPGAEADCGGSR